MRKLTSVVISAAVLLAGVAPTSVLATSDISPVSKTENYVKQAFTLDEMNCFSSDIRALEEATPATTASDSLDTRLASGDSGSNGIPCNSRDPKAPPKKKKRSRS